MTWLPLAIGAIAVVATVGLVGQQSHGFALRSGPPIDPGLAKVGSYLESRGIHHAYGSYWAAYALSAATEERVTLASLAPRRYKVYETLAAHHSPEAIVVFAGGQNDLLLKSTSGLPPYSRTEIGGYAVFSFDHWFDPLTIADWATF